jgi:hypothetical protein
VARSLACSDLCSPKPELYREPRFVILRPISGTSASANPGRVELDLIVRLRVAAAFHDTDGIIGRDTSIEPAIPIYIFIYNFMILFP